LTTNVCPDPEVLVPEMDAPNVTALAVVRGTAAVKRPDGGRTVLLENTMFVELLVSAAWTDTDWRLGGGDDTLYVTCRCKLHANICRQVEATLIAFTATVSSTGKYLKGRCNILVDNI
jgi:hypothetical protein